MYTQIRLPEDLHQHIKQLADQEDRSLNNMMVRLLTEGVDARRRQAESLAAQLGRDPEALAEYIRASQPSPTARILEVPPPKREQSE